MPTKKIIVVINRLPVTLADIPKTESSPSKESPEKSIKSSPSWTDSLSNHSLSPETTPYDVQMIGWPGKPVLPEHTATVQGSFKTEFPSYHPICLTQEEQDAYYLRFSNQTIWALFHNSATYHCFPDIPTISDKDLKLTDTVMQKFADETVTAYNHDKINSPLIWIHDYQLSLLPALLRQKLPTAPIAFFLHIPFPPLEVLEKYPQQRTLMQSLVQSLLCCDQIGFHAEEYRQNFIDTVQDFYGKDGVLYTHETNLLQLTTASGEIRTIKLDVKPLGINFQERATIDIDQAAKVAPETVGKLLQFKKDHPEKIIIGSVDRVDPTKGTVKELIEFMLFLVQLKLDGNKLDKATQDKIQKLKEELIALENTLTNSSGRSKEDQDRNIQEKLTTLSRWIQENLSVFQELKKDNPYALFRIHTKTRESIPAYQQEWDRSQTVKKMVYQLFGEDVLCDFESIPYPQVPAFHQLVDIFWVSTLRDGLHLGTSEFTAAHANDDSSSTVLLSQYAGAAAYYHENAAFIYDPLQTGTAAEQLLAIHQTNVEKLQQMKLARENITRTRFNLNAWKETLIQSIRDAHRQNHPTSLEACKLSTPRIPKTPNFPTPDQSSRRKMSLDELGESFNEALFDAFLQAQAQTPSSSTASGSPNYANMTHPSNDAAPPSAQHSEPSHRSHDSSIFNNASVLFGRPPFDVPPDPQNNHDTQQRPSDASTMGMSPSARLSADLSFSPHGGPSTVPYPQQTSGR